MSHRWLAVGAAILGAVGVTALGALAVAPQVPEASTTATGPADPPAIPVSDDTVVAVLQATGEATSPELRAALRASRADPTDAEAARASARLLIDEGRAAGDSRLVGAALGVLREVMEPPDPATLYLAATARQYQHDFAGALALLDQALALDPSHVNARLTRSTLATVQGRVQDALRDCERLSALRQDVGFLCQSTALIVTPQAPQVAERLAQILDSPGVLDPALEPWAIGLLGEIAVLQGDDATGRARLEDLLARDPEALRERLILADLMLRTDAAAEVAPLLADAPPTDGVLLRRARAARMLGTPDTASEEALAEMVRLNLDLGLDAHAREDAMWALWIAEDPALALDRALADWALQHEPEDAQLLIDAAMAAGDPAAARPVLDWMAEEGISIPALRIPDAVRDAAS